MGVMYLRVGGPAARPAGVARPFSHSGSKLIPNGLMCSSRRILREQTEGKIKTLLAGKNYLENFLWN